MCGIVGFARNQKTPSLLDGDLAKLFGDAMLAGVVRGQDSTGVMFAASGATTSKRLMKFPVCATQLYTTPVWMEMVNRARNSQVVIGHHRAKTTGIISTEAAHPYSVRCEASGRQVWGVHNGSLSTYQLLQDQKTFATDSEWLYYQIAKHGIEVLKDIKGAYALAFMMSDAPGKLFLARNNDRPLTWAHSKDNKAIIFGSEHKMLDWLCGRAGYGVPLEKFSKGHEWAEVPANTVLSFDLENLSTWEETDVTPPKALPVTYPKSTGSCYGAYNSEDDGDWPSVTGGTSTQDWDKRKKLVEYYAANEEEIKEAQEWTLLGSVFEMAVTKVKKKAAGITVTGKVLSGELAGHTVYLSEVSEEWLPYLRDSNLTFRMALHGIRLGNSGTGDPTISAVSGNPLSVVKHVEEPQSTQLALVN